ncbi:uncharacterized protein LOC105778872 [Gossypium raimondii]|uniref:uncharacterized protein LOC105778872 n=1 Tax=Gossypium raimondii TaxID=29730 RepID=UPI00063AC5FA|nr:uncharacterized protein LOC105778872 [Gossypium raimondii]
MRIAESAKNCYKDFTEANMRSKRSDGYSPCCQWRSPTSNFIKVNFDASFKASNNNGGVGVVLRDFEGFVVGAAALKLPVVANTATVKAIVAVKAIETTIGMGFSYVIFEGDARVIMKGLISKEEDFSEIVPILDKAKSLLQQFDKFHINHTRQEGNKAAHELTKFSSTLDNDLYWIEDYAACIHQAILDDAVNL